MPLALSRPHLALVTSQHRPVSCFSTTARGRTSETKDERLTTALGPIPLLQPTIAPTELTSTTGTLEDDRFSERSPASSALPSPIYPTTELAPRPPQHRNKHLSPQEARYQEARYQDARYQDARYQDARFSRIAVPASATSTTTSKPSDGEVTLKSQRSHKSQKPSYATPAKRSTIISVAGSPLASSSSRPSKTTSASTSGGGRFEYAVDRSPLQKLELELKIISNEEPDAPKPGITRTLSRHQAERLHRSTTVTSRLTSDRAPDPYTQNPNRTSALYESMGPKGKPKEYMVPSSNNKDHKHGRFFRYFHGHRSSSSSSSNSSSGENNARNGAATVQKEPVARLTIEDTELIEHHTDELLSEDPEPDYATPYHEEGMPFTLSETLSSGLIILPRSPNTPIFHDSKPSAPTAKGSTSIPSW